ncbi:hypothetical protein HDV01_007609 [Terramyces sp. JEL0728]|nr:hypothetical protein HDV01_007609 [Terramyces sp. JEL0728]
MDASRTVSSLLSLLGNSGDQLSLNPSQQLIAEIRQEHQAKEHSSVDQPEIQLKQVDHNAIIQLIKKSIQEQKEFEEKILNSRVKLAEHLEKKQDEIEAEEIIGSSRISQLKKELNDLKIKLKTLDAELYEAMDKLKNRQQEKLRLAGLDFKITNDPNEIKNQMWILAPYLQHLNS